MATKLMSADEARSKVLDLLKAQPEGMKVAELAAALYGEGKTVEDHRARQARMSFVLRSLGNQVKKGPLNTSPYTINTGRPEPVVHDLPANGKRGRKPGSKNGVSANGSLRSYLIRSIRAQLAELEALE